MRNKAIQALLSLALSLLLMAPAIAQDDPDDVDYLALASLMLRDGNLDRAITALDQVDLSEEGLDLVRYHTLRGMTYMRRDELEPARDSLQRATEAGEAQAVVYVYLAQVNYKLEDWAAAIDALDRAGPAVERIPSVYHMRAQAHWLLGEKAMAIAVLDQASLVFPEDASFQRRKVFYLIDQLRLGICVAPLLGIILPVYLITRRFPPGFKWQLRIKPPRPLPAMYTVVATLAVVVVIDFIYVQSQQFMPAPTEAKTTRSPGSMWWPSSRSLRMRSSRVGMVATELLPRKEMVIGMMPLGISAISA